MNASTLVQKLWNYCNVLRDDGMSYGDYVEKVIDLLLADGRRAYPADVGLARIFHQNFDLRVECPCECDVGG